MALKKIGEYDAQNCLVSALGEARRVEVGRPVFRRGNFEDEIFTPDYQANIANAVLDLIGHDSSERYQPKDFVPVRGKVPQGMDRNQLKALQDGLRTSFGFMVLDRNELS